MKLGWEWVLLDEKGKLVIGQQAESDSRWEVTLDAWALKWVICTLIGQHWATRWTPWRDWGERQDMTKILRTSRIMHTQILFPKVSWNTADERTSLVWRNYWIWLQNHNIEKLHDCKLWEIRLHRSINWIQRIMAIITGSNGDQRGRTKE